MMKGLRHKELQQAAHQGGNADEKWILICFEFIVVYITMGTLRWVWPPRESASNCVSPPPG